MKADGELVSRWPAMTYGFDRREALVVQPMTVPALASAGHSTRRRAAELMREHDVECLPVVDGGRLVGLLTEADLMEVGATPGEEQPPVCAGCRTRRHVRRAFRQEGAEDRAIDICLQCLEVVGGNA